MKKIISKIAELNKADKAKLALIAIMLVITVSFGGREIYNIISKTETIIKSKTELQTFLNDTAWVKEEDGKTSVLLFSQFMDIYDATLDGDEEIYNSAAVYSILDYSHIEVYDLSGRETKPRLDGKHELIIESDKTLILDGEKFEKDDDFTKWLRKIYYD